jgi:hypothetical protein
VVHCGRKEKSEHCHEFDFYEVYEPTVRGQQEIVSPEYYSQPYSETAGEILRSLPECAIITIPARLAFIFKKSEQSQKHFAGMALPTNKSYDLS